jgi:hypothetical protein
LGPNFFSDAYSYVNLNLRFGSPNVQLVFSVNVGVRGRGRRQVYLIARVAAPHLFGAAPERKNCLASAPRLALRVIYCTICTGSGAQLAVRLQQNYVGHPFR